jgi:glycerophosphoryl diester phosphodiesterase
MSAPDWLTARPVAHRGLHDAAAGIIENTPSAITAAIAGGYSIEVDLQITADGEAMVHHDDALGRLTDGAGALAALSAAELKRVRFKATADQMLTLGELLDLVAGRVGLFLELKSHFDGDARLPRRVAEVLESHAGTVATMSFDPLHVHAMRDFAQRVPRGIVAERRGAQGASASDALAYLGRTVRGAPQFVAYSVKELPSPAPWLARHVFGMPLLTWTVRSDEDRRRAERFADQMIFEGFRPDFRP